MRHPLLVVVLLGNIVYTVSQQKPGYEGAAKKPTQTNKQDTTKKHKRERVPSTKCIVNIAVGHPQINERFLGAKMKEARGTGIVSKYKIELFIVVDYSFYKQ
ncbi:hypothetical protein CHS0354_042453 [Potamilus streckersoni]|uniref:Secreted protein n=1 Tax=Potamilus streckersoni TaxID=2493646 RepID=A0AAE0VRN3_9BIVA|nr:hypothetical protein CHS0354_042453 [Potamilus streckersoni]